MITFHSCLFWPSKCALECVRVCEIEHGYGYAFCVSEGERQCDQIGLFLHKVWATRFLTNLAQIFCNILGHFEKILFLSKNCSGNFGQHWVYFLFQRLVTLVIGETRTNLVLELTEFSVANLLNTSKSEITTLESLWPENCQKSMSKKFSMDFDSRVIMNGRLPIVWFYSHTLR